MYSKKVLVCKSSDCDSVRIASDLLRAGNVIALPTDTVYGLACSANDPESIQRLYAIKGREEKKPVAICVADYEDLRYWGDAKHLPISLLKKLLPGPVTIVVDKSPNLDNPFLNCGVKKIGIRIPDFDFIRDLSRNFKYPIALTSANKSSEKSTLNIKEFEKLWPLLGGVFDGGPLGIEEEQRAASTVVDLSKEGCYKIIRDGVAISHTVEVMKEFGILEL